MGLDNIPALYPCKKQGTVVLAENGAVDCDATRACGGCPWANANPPEKGRVYGMMGASCWYRGKWGNALLEYAGLYDELDHMSFYGDTDDGAHKSPESCDILAEVIETRLSDRRAIKDQEGNSLRDDLRYAAWWLRWVADQCGGSTCWY